MASNTDATITLSIVAKDLASGNISKAVSGLDQLAKKGGLAGSMVQGMGMQFGMMVNPVMLAGQAIGAVTDFLAEGVSSAIAEEKSLASLDTALENNVKGWDGNRDAIDKAIESRMELGFEDDALRASFAKLVTASGDVNKSLSDQQLAMDIARGTGKDLATATDIVTKANMGNVGALRRMGIELQKGATKTEILAELQKRYGGQAEAYAETTAGAMEVAQIAIGEAAEDIGKELLPVVKDLATFISGTLAPAISGTVKLLSDLGAEIPKVTSATGDLMDTIPGLDDFFPDQGGGVLGGTIFDSLLDGIHEATFAMGRERPAAVIGEQIMDHAAEGTRAHANVWAAAAADAGDDAGDGVKEGWLQSTGNWGFLKDSLDEAKRIASESGRGINNNLADALRGTKDVVASAMDDVAWAIKHPMALTRQIAEVEGALTTLEYKRGLASNTDTINTVIDQQMQNLRDEWTNLTGIAYGQGANAGRAWFRGYSQAAGADQDRYTGDWTPNSTPRRRRNRASGGPVSANTPYVVGEERAEWFVPESDGYVHPTVPAGLGGNVNVNISFPSLIPYSGAQMQAAVRVLVPELTREMQRQRLAPSPGFRR